MNQEYRAPNTDSPTDQPQDDSAGSSRLQSEERHAAEEKEPCRHKDYPEDEVDKAMRAFGRWLIVRFKEAKFIDFVQMVLGVLVLSVAIFAASVYDGQLRTMNAQLDATGVEVGSHAPVIFPAAMDPIWETSEKGIPQIRIRTTYTNFGDTEAINPRFIWGWDEKPQNANSPYRAESDAWIRSYWAHSIAGFDDGPPMSVEQARDLAKHPLYIYGIVQYFDMFPITKDHPRKDHRVQWCLRARHLSVVDAKHTSWTYEVSKEGGSCLDDGCGDAYTNHRYDPPE